MTQVKSALEMATTAKISAEKKLADCKAAAKTMTEKAESAQVAADKITKEKAEAEKTIARCTKAIPDLLDQAALARTKLIGGLKPLPGSAWDYAKARHLLWRAGFGGSPDEVAKLHAMGLQMQVDFRSVYAAMLEKWLKVPSEAVLAKKYPLVECIA